MPGDRIAFASGEPRFPWAIAGDCMIDQQSMERTAVPLSEYAGSKLSETDANSSSLMVTGLTGPLR
jgi:hypothetical protein